MGPKALLSLHFRTPVRARELVLAIDTVYVDANYQSGRVEFISPRSIHVPMNAACSSSTSQHIASSQIV